MSLQFVLDDKGNKVAVILPVEEYEKICEALEELESIRAYDAAKASRDEVIPFEYAIEDIERSRR
jgi:PHD/YefM family antitoxin component YafN of YafNO toxin-antitoxin module